MKKRLLTLTLFSALTALSVFAANGVYTPDDVIIDKPGYTIDSGNELKDAAANLDGRTLMVTDATASYHWLCNSTFESPQNVRSRSVKDARSSMFAYMTFKKVANAKCTTKGNLYTVQMTTSSGSPYALWGENGYFNANPSTDCLFALGLKDNYGQDGNYLGLWKIDYEEGKGYTMINVGALEAGNKCYAYPVSPSDRLALNDKGYVRLFITQGEMDDYVVNESGKLDICAKNTSSDYKVYDTPTMIPESTSLSVYTSRYTDFNAPIAGKGTLNLYCGGERTYLGEHVNKKYPSWAQFTGDVHIYPYKEVEKSAGFYGVVMAHNGKTFSPSNIEDCILTGKVCTMMGNNRVFLHDGAAIAFENGTRAAQFGELNTEAGSRIYGYYKTSGESGSYLIVGGNGNDATLAGRIAPMEKDGKPYASSLLGIIKDGKGTYSITANDNAITGGLRIVRGRVNVNNDANAAQSGKLSGGTGVPGANTCAAYVMRQGVLGGYGNIAGDVEVYGVLEPGTKEPGTLTLKNYASNTSTILRMHPEGTLRFKVSSKDCYDKLVVNNEIELSNRMEDFSISEDNPSIRITLADNYDIKVNDEFTLITAADRKGADAWKWNIIYPKRLTWEAKETQTGDGRYALIVRVTSLNDDPANANNDDNDSDDEGGNESWTDTFQDNGDTHSMRYYAEKAGMRIGVAVPSSRINLTNANDASTKIIMREFNMVVPENELKFDWTEPSLNYFNYGDAEKLLTFAEKNNMYMRGHTLAWHQQVAQWVSSDGKKNDKNWTKQQLMNILKNHIINLVGHFKGRIGEWDVVNECIEDDQSIVYSNPNGYKLRTESVWTRVCGEDYIDSAFVWAHRADPNAKLFLNDYSNESKGYAKSEAFYNLAKRLHDNGIPIHGVGFQCHLDAGNVDVNAIRNNIIRFGELGLECAITELDLGISADTEEQRQQQARDFYRIIEAAMNQKNCKSVMIWGLSDNLSWRQSTPLLYNSNLQPKPAYYAVRSSLNACVTTDIPNVQASETIDAPTVKREYFSVGGMRLNAPSAKSITIVKETRADGTVKTYKLYSSF